MKQRYNWFQTTKEEEMSGKRSRTKGHSFEREIAKFFQTIGYLEAKRHLEYQSEEVVGVDLDNTGPYKVQCKRNKGYAPINKIFEIQDMKDCIPLLITKADNKPAMVVMPLSDFAVLAKKKGL